jgi:hypothetical protein
MPRQIQLSAKGRTHSILVDVRDRLTGRDGQVMITLAYGVASMEYVNDAFRRMGCNLMAFRVAKFVPEISAPF